MPYKKHTKFKEVISREEELAKSFCEKPEYKYFVLWGFREMAHLGNCLLDK